MWECLHLCCATFDQCTTTTYAQHNPRKFPFWPHRLAHHTAWPQENQPSPSPPQMCPHMRSLLLPLACCSNPSRLAQCSAPACLRAPSAVGECHCVWLHLHSVAKHLPTLIFPLLFVWSFLADPPLSFARIALFLDVSVEDQSLQHTAVCSVAGQTGPSNLHSRRRHLPCVMFSTLHVCASTPVLKAPEMESSLSSDNGVPGRVDCTSAIFVQPGASWQRCFAAHPMCGCCAWVTVALTPHMWAVGALCAMYRGSMRL